MGQSFLGTRITNVVVRNAAEGGIVVVSGVGSDRTTRDSRTVWRDTVIAGNTVESALYGITFNQHFTIGNRVSGLTLAHNTVRIAQTEGPDAIGIGVDSGLGAGSRDNVTSGVIIADNTVEGNAHNAILVASGSSGASDNRMGDVRIFGNRLLSAARQANGQETSPLALMTGDGASDEYDKVNPITYPERNVIERVAIHGNVIAGQGGNGVTVMSGLTGGKANVIRDVEIAGNRIEGVVGPGGWHHNGVLVGAGNGEVKPESPTRNEIADVRVTANSISSTGVRPGLGGFEVAWGGVAVWGGRAGEANTIRDVRITNNRVDTPIVGISVVGGLGHAGPANGNLVTRTFVACNVVVREPRLVASQQPGVKGINLVGGILASTQNRVEVELADNLVVGKLNDVSVAKNVGAGARGNEVVIRP